MKGCIVAWLVWIAVIARAADARAGDARAQTARPIVPGTGVSIDYVNDDFEDPNWKFTHRHPKSSREQDEQLRGPRGTASNGRWTEGPERGQPDQIETIELPEEGLPGSRRGLLLRTLHSGIPGRRTQDVQQDDLIFNSLELLGPIPAAELPNFTVRVWLPPFAEWEQRSGPQFGVRMSTSTTVTERGKGFLAGMETKAEPYWPGMWIHYRRGSTRGKTVDGAFIAYRGNRLGHDVRVREVEQTGWWTFGMSLTADGAVHYYARPGVGELTADDHLTSQFPYGYRAEQFRTFFFDVCNQNDGQSWSTAFVIDDPQLYVVKADRIEGVVQRKIQAQEKRLLREAARARKRR
jgi:hypothetical protein